MATLEVKVNARFPGENIEKKHGRVDVHGMTATVTRIAKSPPSEGYTAKVIKVVMSCTGNLDTHTILVEDPEILRMFVEKDGQIVIDFVPLNVMIPIFALEPAGPMPDNEGEEDTEEDFEMLRNMGKVCRLVWGHHKGLAQLNKEAAVAMRAKRERDELADQASNAERAKRLAVQPNNHTLGGLQAAYAPPPSTTSQYTRVMAPPAVAGSTASKKPHRDPSQAPAPAPKETQHRIRIGGHTLSEPDEYEGHWSDAEEDNGGQTAADSTPTGTLQPEDIAALVQLSRAEIEAAQAKKARPSAVFDETISDLKATEDNDRYDPFWVNNEDNLEGEGGDQWEEDPDDNSEDFGDSGEKDDDDESDEDFEDFGQSAPVKRKRLQGTPKKVSQPSRKRLGKQPAKSTSGGANTQPRKLKPRTPDVMAWPTTIITTGTAGNRLQPLMAEMGQVLTTEAERQQYMDLVWTRRRVADAGDDAAAKQAVVDDLENFVRHHGIVDMHNLWARWMESGIKVAMPMYKPTGTGVMNAEERKKMFERKNKARRG